LPPSEGREQRCAHKLDQIRLLGLHLPQYFQKFEILGIFPECLVDGLLSLFQLLHLAFPVRGQGGLAPVLHQQRLLVAFMLALQEGNEGVNADIYAGIDTDIDTGIVRSRVAADRQAAGKRQ